MSVQQPKSGEKITKQSVIKMHDTVRQNINNCDENFIGPSSFSFDQMSTGASPLVAFDSVNRDGTSPIAVTSFGTGDQASDVTGDPWQELTAFRLDNNGSTFITTNDSAYVVFFTCRIDVVKQSGTVIAADPNVHAAFAIAHEDNSGNITVIDSSIMCYGLYGTNPLTTSWEKQEIPVAIWCSFSFTGSKIIDRIRIYSAILKGSAGALNLPNQIFVERGTSGCYVFERV